MFSLGNLILVEHHALSFSPQLSYSHFHRNLRNWIKRNIHYLFLYVYCNNCSNLKKKNYQQQIIKPQIDQYWLSPFVLVSDKLSPFVFVSCSKLSPFVLVSWSKLFPFVSFSRNKICPQRVLFIAFLFINNGHHYFNFSKLFYIRIWFNML